MAKKLTRKYLKEVMSYDQEIGIFTWNVRKDVPKNWNKKYAGNIVGWNHSHGYKQICINYKKYFFHRLAWFYVYGIWPKEIDHIDRDKANNKIENLRDVSHIRNCYNRDSGKKALSGYKGVSYDKRYGTWGANVRINKITKYLGTFKCPTAAHLARCKAVEELSAEFAKLA